jgi:hypothetical protein
VPSKGQPFKEGRGTTVSQFVYLSGAEDNDNKCKAGIIQFSNSKAAQTEQEITKREEFPKKIELTRKIIFSSGLQTRTSDKSLADSLEETVIWNTTHWPLYRWWCNSARDSEGVYT